MGEHFNIWDHWQVERPEEFQFSLPRQLWLICEIKRRVKTGKVLKLGAVRDCLKNWLYREGLRYTLWIQVLKA